MTHPQSQQWAAWIIGGILLAFHAWVFVWGPNNLPPHKHLILAVLSALLVGILGYLVTGNFGINGEINLGIGKFDIKAAGGMGMFVLVLMLWYSRLSPVKSVEQLEDIKERVEYLSAQQKQQPTNADLAHAVQKIQESIDESKISGENIGKSPLTPDLIASAKALLERGNKEQRALAQIALKNYEDADRLIQELKKDPIEDAFRVLMLEGDNWSNAGKFDRAIVPFEQALALHPDNVNARTNLAVAHQRARQGNMAGHYGEAIAILEETLRLVSPGSPQWATIQNARGNAYARLPTGDHRANIEKAIAAYQAVLSVNTRNINPAIWAITQNNLGLAYTDLPTGDRSQSLSKAISAFEAALTVQTLDSDPVRWAATQNNVGRAYAALPSDRSKNIAKAIAVYEAALSPSTKDVDLFLWALIQNNLGSAYADLPTGDRGLNLTKASAAYEAALTVNTKDCDPVQWALVEGNLGTVYAEPTTGQHKQDLPKAIAAFEAALAVSTKDADLDQWANVQNNLGNAYARLPGGDDSENQMKAIHAYNAALSVRTQTSDPINWAMTQSNLGGVYRSLLEGDRSQNLAKAITAYDAALTIFTKDADPTRWAGTECNLAAAYAALPTGDISQNLATAVSKFTEALTVVTKDTDPVIWASIQNGLGNALANSMTSDRGATLSKAIGAYELALSVATKTNDPVQWAAVHNNLAIALSALADVPGMDRLGLLRRALASCKAALTVRTVIAFPDKYANTSRVMQIILKSYNVAGGKDPDAISPAE